VSRHQVFEEDKTAARDVKAMLLHAMLARGKEKDAECVKDVSKKEMTGM
jgi:hypothetical protein